MLYLICFALLCFLNLSLHYLFWSTYLNFALTLRYLAYPVLFPRTPSLHPYIVLLSFLFSLLFYLLSLLKPALIRNFTNFRGSLAVLYAPKPNRFCVGFRLRYAPKFLTCKNPISQNKTTSYAYTLFTTRNIPFSSVSIPPKTPVANLSKFDFSYPLCLLFLPPYPIHHLNKPKLSI